MQRLRAFLNFGDIDGFRVGVIGCLFFLLVAANILLKILRDSVFLVHHSVSELPYLYILVALLAGVVIASYTRYTANISIVRLMLATNAVIIFNISFFWVVLTYFDPGWSHYAFYIWSAVATVIAVAQAWAFVGEIFTQAEGERIFGLIAAGGTVGGATAAFGSKWAVEQSFEANQLLWIVVALFLTASVLLLWLDRRLNRSHVRFDTNPVHEFGDERVHGMGSLLGGSRYLQVITLFILVSAIVSTFIDFHFKAAAKEAYQSTETLAAFLSSYYGWLSIVTFFVQSILTARVFATFGLFPSLYITPAVLLTGATGMLLWPGLMAAALTRMADTVLRQSVHRSSMEILYIPLPARVKRKVKTFLDVVVERVGDASAGFIILLVSFWSADIFITKVHIIWSGLLLVWMLLIPVLRRQGSDTVTQSRSNPSIRTFETVPGENSQRWQKPDKNHQL